MRQRGMALTTERSNVRHFRDFMKRRKLKEASAMCATEFKAYLDYEGKSKSMKVMDRGIIVGEVWRNTRPPARWGVRPAIGVDQFVSA